MKSLWGTTIQEYYITIAIVAEYHALEICLLEYDQIEFETKIFWAQMIYKLNPW